MTYDLSVHPDYVLLVFRLSLVSVTADEESGTLSDAARAAFIAFLISIATVMGPTTPGPGVI